MQHLRLSSQPLPLPGWAQSADLKQTCPIKDTHTLQPHCFWRDNRDKYDTELIFNVICGGVFMCRFFWQVGLSPLLVERESEREKYQQLIKSRPCSSRSHLLCRLNMATIERERDRERNGARERGARESNSIGVNCAISPFVQIENETGHDSNVHQGTPAFKEH